MPRYNRSTFQGQVAPDFLNRELQKIEEAIRALYDGELETIRGTPGGNGPLLVYTDGSYDFGDGLTGLYLRENGVFKKVQALSYSIDPPVILPVNLPVSTGSLRTYGHIHGVTPIIIPPAPAGLTEHPGGVNTIAQMELFAGRVGAQTSPFINRWNTILAYADARINESPTVSATYTVPPYYENASGHNTAKFALANDVQAAWACAFVWYIKSLLNGAPLANNTYANRAVTLMNAWATQNDVITIDEETPLVVSYTVPSFIQTGELLYDYPQWTTTQRNNWESWLEANVHPAADFKKLRSLQENPDGTYSVKAGTTTPFYSNHNCWGLLTSLYINKYLENQSNFDRDVELLKALIHFLIRNDGGLPSELSRGSSSILYTGFALEALTASAELVRNVGDEILFEYVGASGGSLRKGLDFMYNKGIVDPSQWPQQSAVGNYGNHAAELFSAAGRIYGEAAWHQWAETLTGTYRLQLPDFGGNGFTIPSTLQCEPF